LSRHFSDNCGKNNFLFFPFVVKAFHRQPEPGLLLIRRETSKQQPQSSNPPNQTAQARKNRRKKGSNAQKSYAIFSLLFGFGSLVNTFSRRLINEISASPLTTTRSPSPKLPPIPRSPKERNKRQAVARRKKHMRYKRKREFSEKETSSKQVLSIEWPRKWLKNH
jgi:hypothetical protein